MVWSLLGLSADQQAKGEVGSLNRTNTSFDSWDLGDIIRSTITGVSKEDILKRAQQVATQQINDSNTQLIGSTRRALAGTGLEGSGLSYKPGQTESQFQDSLNDDLSRGTAAREYLSLDGSDPSKITGDTQVSDLITLSTQARKDEKEKQRGQQLDDKRDDRRYETGLIVEQRKAENDRYNHQFRTGEARRAHESQQAQLDRALERQLSNNNSDMQMQIAQMNSDLADKRMAYDRETKRMDRRDRAIAQLMAGLGQLGGAFSL